MNLHIEKQGAWCLYSMWILPKAKISSTHWSHCSKSSLKQSHSKCHQTSDSHYIGCANVKCPFSGSDIIKGMYSSGNYLNKNWDKYLDFKMDSRRAILSEMLLFLRKHDQILKSKMDNSLVIHFHISMDAFSHFAPKCDTKYWEET